MRRSFVRKDLETRASKSRAVCDFGLHVLRLMPECEHSDVVSLVLHERDHLVEYDLPGGKARLDGYCHPDGETAEAEVRFSGDGSLNDLLARSRAATAPVRSGGNLSPEDRKTALSLAAELAQRAGFV